MTRRRVWFKRLGLVALLLLIGQQVWRHGHDYVFADKFYAIEPGKVYRGAWQQTWPMKRIIRDPSIREKIAALGYIPNETPSIEEMRRYVESERLKWGGMVKELGLEGSQ